MFGQRLIAEHKLLQIMRIYIDPAKMREKYAAAVTGSGPRYSKLFPNISILGGWEARLPTLGNIPNIDVLFPLAGFYQGVPHVKTNP
jgi:hypothetical protein